LLLLYVSHLLFRESVESSVQEKNKAVQHGLKMHLFLNVPPEERAPGSLGNPGQLKDHINLFNSVLVSHIIRFAESNPGQPTDLTILAV